MGTWELFPCFSSSWFLNSWDFSNVFNVQSAEMCHKTRGVVSLNHVKLLTYEWNAACLDCLCVSEPVRLRRISVCEISGWMPHALKHAWVSVDSESGMSKQRYNTHKRGHICLFTLMKTKLFTLTWVFQEVVWETPPLLAAEGVYEWNVHTLIFEEWKPVCCKYSQLKAELKFVIS